MAQFDRHDALAALPDEIKNRLLLDDVVNEVNAKLERLSEQDRSRIEVVLYLMNYLEHRLSHPKAGPLRKQVILRVLGSSYRGQQLDDLVEFLHKRELIDDLNIVVRAFRILVAYLKFKFL